MQATVLPLAGPRAQYQQLDTPRTGAIGESLPACCRGCLCGVLGAGLALVLTFGLLVRLLHGETPEVREPCVDVVPLGACTWAGALLLRSAWGQARCQRTFGLCVPFDAGEFSLERIANDEVEYRLAYAKTGSPLPASLHGIWWMDQWGANVPVPGDPSYAYAFPMKCNELLLTFGEVEWDPATRCTTPNWQVGGPRGHWTFNDEGGGANEVWLGPTGRGFLTFCFTPDFSSIDVHVAIKAPPKAGFFLGLGGFKRVGGGYHGYHWLPPALVKFQMVKKPWGWDRVTMVGAVPDTIALQLSEYLPEEISYLLSTPLQTYHYPVFSIVDGDGRRTEHYEAYLKWSNRETTPGCECSGGCGCKCNLNEGRGTSLLAVWKPPPRLGPDVHAPEAPVHPNALGV